MFNMVVVKGFYGDENGKSYEGSVMVQFVSHAAAETLTVSFPNRYKIDLSFRPVEAMVKRLRQELRGRMGAGRAHDTLERSITVPGLYSDSRIRRQKGQVTVWCRCSPSFEMLTLEFANSGQISVPYRSILPLVRRERGKYV